MKDEIEDDCMEDIVNGIHFYKENKSNKIWWVDNLGVIGSIEFSFDKKTIVRARRFQPHLSSAEIAKS